MNPCLTKDPGWGIYDGWVRSPSMGQMTLPGRGGAAPAGRGGTAGGAPAGGRGRQGGRGAQDQGEGRQQEQPRGHSDLGAGDLGDGIILAGPRVAMPGLLQHAQECQARFVE